MERKKGSDHLYPYVLCYIEHKDINDLNHLLCTCFPELSMIFLCCTPYLDILNCFVEYSIT